MYNLYSIYLGRLARILPLGVITVLASAFSANAEDTCSCTINADKDFYSAICLHATLQQLHNALKKGSQIDLQFPNELANAPVSVVIERVLLESLLRSALGSYNYIVSNIDDAQAITKVTVVGLRDATTDKGFTFTPVPAFENLLQPDIPGPIPSPMQGGEMTVNIDTGSVVTAGPTPGPEVKVLVNHPQPTMPTPGAGAVRLNGTVDVPSAIPYLVTAPPDSIKAPDIDMTTQPSAAEAHGQALSEKPN